MFIIAIILAVLAIVAVVAAVKFKRKEPITRTDPYGRGKITQDFTSETKIARISAAILVALALVATLFSSLYFQDVGEAKVLKDFTGNIIGQDTSEGAALKAPWSSAINFDIRNQMAAYIGDGEDNYNGEKPNGPQITVQDKEGVSANLDIVVIYSIAPDAVTDIYSQYRSQENFTSRVIEQDIRSVVRNVPATYGTLELLNGREQAGADITAELTDAWADKGITVNSVALQGIRYSDGVKERFDDAQAARIEVETAKAKLASTEVSAQSAVVTAQANAEANAILAASLTEPILQQNYLDTLGKLAAEGNLVVVPEGFNGLVNVSK